MPNGASRSVIASSLSGRPATMIVIASYPTSSMRASKIDASSVICERASAVAFTVITRDFRKATWEASALDVGSGRSVAKIALPKAGYRAFFGEMDFEVDGIAHPLSTQIRVLEAKR